MDDDTNERAESYRFLADLFFIPPQAEAVNTIREDLGLASTDTIDEIAADFNEIFPYPGGKLSPLESVFLEASGGEPGKVLSSVTNFYAYAGLEIEEDFQAYPDHLALEFLFMSYLIETNKIDLQSDFLKTHIMNWVPFYCDELARLAQTGFYRELAEAVKDFLDSEYEELV